MTGNAQRLTDDLLRQALVELAAGPDADTLMTDVMRSVDTQVQVGRRPWDTRGWGRALVLAAAVALLVAATIGATVVLTQPQPSPLPTRSPLPLSNEVIRVADFTVPFSYRVPVGMSGKLAVDYTPDNFYAIRPKTGDSGSFIVFPITGQNMQVFPAQGGTEKCLGFDSELATDEDVTKFLQGLDEGPISPTTLGGQPAWAIDIDPIESDCRNALLYIHQRLDGPALQRNLTLAYPGRLIVARTAAGTVGALTYAPTNAALADWRPIADALVSGFTFGATALSDQVLSVSDFAVPFSYRLPVGANAKLEGHGSQNKVYIVDARAGGPGRLELFPVSGYAHGCGTSSGNSLPTFQIGSGPDAFLDALRDTVGVGLGPNSPTTVGGLPAVAADLHLTEGTCDRAALHLDGLGLSYATYEPALNRPGRLIVSRTGGTTIGLFISAPNETDLDGWLPIAQAYLDGLVFEAGQ